MRNGIWKDVVAKYFELNGNKIIANVQKWATTNKEIAHYTGGDAPRRDFLIQSGRYRTG